MGSTWCRFMRDVQKGATLSPVLSAVEGTGEAGGVPAYFYPLPEKEATVLEVKSLKVNKTRAYDA